MVETLSYVEKRKVAFKVRIQEGAPGWLVAPSTHVMCPHTGCAGVSTHGMCPHTGHVHTRDVFLVTTALTSKRKGKRKFEKNMFSI